MSSSPTGEPPWRRTASSGVSAQRASSSTSRRNPWICTSAGGRSGRSSPWRSPAISTATRRSAFSSSTAPAIRPSRCSWASGPASLPKRPSDSFRFGTPSEESERPMPYKKLPGNAPCPCGSGNRYEACCWDKGFERVEDEAATEVRSTPMTPEVREALEQLRQAFIAKDGREPGPDDLLFPDMPPPRTPGSDDGRGHEGSGPGPGLHLCLREDRAARHAAESTPEPRRRPGRVGCGD